MNHIRMLAGELEKYGCRLTVTHNGAAQTVWAILEPNRRKNRYHLQYEASEIGRYYNNYYFYYGPASFDIRALGEEDEVCIDGERYAFVQTDAVRFAGRILYFRGVLIRQEGTDVSDTGA